MTNDEDKANRLESMALTVLFFAISLALLLALFAVTRPGQASGGWWTRPALAPGVALGLLVLANLVTLARSAVDLRRRPATTAERAEARARMLGWLRPLEFLAYFAGYIWALGLVGYFAATLLFLLGLMLRVGLRSPRWLLAGALTALALTAVFRMGLGVWMPPAMAYDLFPAAIRTALTRWF
ncbi:tripartite tricarboxylate transporter TctB family protein [Fertoebacter nigrum]|uniref:Tripartite tricarboxylate transporter TctB family protein n=1 Tax=Fertoeibacter niger TaxID=2656921 RepID=A0A8X8H2S3_9RHOB|nr:tripartite tricarboxylate transporter TctB family protein [Fertoeibacter niger]NUB45239.1 tripartite tricarboxylate transporter TctB family protein [Fertoeibacter niger]